MGKFIVLEGGEGSGKTTISNKIITQLKKDGYKILHTREPGGVDIAEQIRDVILSNKNAKMDPKTEALLFAASRRQHLVEKVIPALEAGKIVICDRFIHSSLVYQGIARNIGIKHISDINSFAIEKYMPDLVIYLDMDPELGLKKTNARKEENDRLDNETLEFHKKVRKGYLDLSKKDKTMVTVTATKTIEEKVEKVYKIIKEFLEK